MIFNSESTKRLTARILFLMCFAGILSGQLPAQEIRDSTILKIDSSRLTKFNTDSVKKYFISTDTLLSFQLNKIQKYILYFSETNSRLSRSFDTTEISIGLQKIDSVISQSINYISGFKGKKSLKILSTTHLELKQALSSLTKWQEELSKYNNELNEIKKNINQAIQDTVMLIMPADSLLFLEYLKKLSPLGKKINTADSLTTSQLKSLGVFQNRVSGSYLKTNELLYEINSVIKAFSSRILDREFNYIWDSQNDSVYRNNFKSVVDKSIQKSEWQVKYYVISIWQPRLLVILLGFIYFIWMRKNINSINKNKENSQTILNTVNHIPNHLLSSTIVVSLMIIPIIYKTAPQAYILILWSIQMIAIGILIRDRISLSSVIQYLIALLLFFITGFTNLLIEITYFERWILIVVSVVSLALGLWLLFSKNETKFTKTIFFKPLIIAFIIMNGSALLLNIFGRVTLSKILNTGANYGLIEAFKLFVFIEILIDVIYLSLQAGKNTTRLASFFDFNKLETRLRKILGIFAAFIWLVIFTKNLHIYDFIFGNIFEILEQKHTFGDIEFSFGSIAIFVIIIWISTLISQMVSIIFGNQGINGQGENTGKLGSSVLLIRIGILTAGILLAFGASGIPLDKLAIIVGALGVGIGFGLQTIVNNLVSGIVLAFEKPIRIGDIIEVGDKEGTVKEIGIRSISLITFDGSELIIPNGDMLSQHLVNWSKSSQTRRITVPIGIAYGSDINRAKEMIMQILENNENILNYPKPVVKVNNFGDNSVDLNLYFWSEIKGWSDLRSDIMIAVYDLLNKEGIEIPFPQRDLHIRSVDEDIISDLSKNKKDKTEDKDK